MLTIDRFLLAVFMVVALAIHTIGFSQQAHREPASKLHPFSSRVLLERFDRNRSGVLEHAEKISLREAFNGIDVPLLPDPADDYLHPAVPAYLQDFVTGEADNTPAGNPTTNQGAVLGRVLFYDRQLSGNGTTACASCHVQQAGFTDGRRVSVGYEGGLTRRNSMGLLNIRYTNIQSSHPGFFWDERAASLEAQVLMPIQDPVEMGMALSDLELKLQALPYYPPLFDAAFGSPEVTSDRLARAVAQFMRSMESWQTRFDKAADVENSSTLWGQFRQLTEQENLGKSLFIEGIRGVAEFGCAHCHLPPTFGMTRAMNNGLDLEYDDSGLGALNRTPNDPFTPSDHGKFKAPSLRNIALTAPYMHDGRFDSLEQVVEHYSNGVNPHENLELAFESQDSADSKLGFQYSDSQKAALVAFLKTLTDHAFIEDPKFSDPFVRLPASAASTP